MWSRYFQLQPGLPDSSVFLKILCFRNKAVGNKDDLTLCTWFARCSSVVNTLFQPRVEALDGLIGIVGLSQLLIVLSTIHDQGPHVMIIKVAEELKCGWSGVSCEGVIERLEVSAVERRQQLIAECSVNVMILIVLLTLFGVLMEERLLFKWSRYSNPTCHISKPTTIIELFITVWILYGRYYNLYMFHCSSYDTPPLVEVHDHHTDIIYIYLYKFYLVTWGADRCEENDIVMKIFMRAANMNYCNIIRSRPIIYLVSML